MCSKFDKMINDGDKKITTNQRWDLLKMFVPTKYTNMKLKAHECSANAAGLGTAANMEVAAPSIKDYATVIR